MRYERILLTAFEPWADEPVNSSWLAIESLEGQTLHGAKIKAVSLPVDRASSLRLLREAARRDDVLEWKHGPNDRVRVVRYRSLSPDPFALLPLPCT